MTDAFADDLWADVPDALEARLRPVFEDIARGSRDRERDRELPFDAVRALRDAGVTTARLPADDGGWGLSWREFAAVLTALAAADSNLPQILRGHIALVEQTITSAEPEFRRRWTARLREGAVVGNAWSEPSAGGLVRSGTELTEHDDGSLVISGRKYYTTGSIFGEWTDAMAHRTADGAEVTALVRLDQPGVEVYDDWDGFGQRLTGTGTILFEGAAVDEGDVLPVAERFGYQTALYQLVLLAVLSGIAHAAVADAADAVRARTRVYSHGLAPRARDDGQIQALVGELAAAAFSASSTTLAVADALDAAHAAAVAAREDPDPADAAREAASRAEIRAARAQSVVTEQVQRLTSRLFDALGASATSAAAGLDRHWRNARTVSSHNPVLYKNRWIGRWVLEGTPPDPLWSVGEPDREAAQTA